MEKLMPAMNSGRNISLNIRVSNAVHDSPKDLLDGLASVMRDTAGASSPERSDQVVLPNTIRFPYSRHSSYSELCDFLNVFKPRDVWPCTVDREKWLRNCQFFFTWREYFVSGRADTDMFDSSQPQPSNPCLENIVRARSSRMTWR